MDECPSWQTTRAHPRSRGENPTNRPKRGCQAGSSPLTRGKRASLVDACHDGGLIPAHAGKTVDKATFDQIKGAHPRSRGENTSSKPRLSKASGSSPLTRGKQTQGHEIGGDLRLIPAHAGKT